MTSAAYSHAQPQQLHIHRLSRLRDELRFALSRTDAAVLREWGGRSAGRLVRLTGQRVGALSDLVKSIGRAGVAEAKGFGQAVRSHRISVHLGDRTAAAIDGTISVSRTGASLARSIGNALVENPKDNAPKVLAAFLGFYAGSGGVDGDGGIPDLDLLAGIDAHRSLLTHSILAGVLAEGLLLAVVDLASQIGDRLPHDHDPLWDRLAAAAAPLSGPLTAGASAGIAYHLLWDAGIEPAAYHGLPVEMPMEAHAGLMGANGVAEAAYVDSCIGNNGPTTFTQGPPSEASTGRKFVETVGRSVDAAGQLGKDFFGRFNK